MTAQATLIFIAMVLLGVAGYLDLRSNTRALRPTSELANGIFRFVGATSAVLYFGLIVYAFFITEWYFALGIIIVSLFAYVFIGQGVLRSRLGGAAPGITFLLFIVGIGVSTVAIF